MSVGAVPEIKREVRDHSDDATRYGYVAFKEIDLRDGSGRAHSVQPDNSPYFNIIPARRLIPFITIDVSETDEAKVNARGRKKYEPPVTWRKKSALECVTEMERSYEDWGFVNVKALAGADTPTASLIFQTIQPFEYALADLEAAVNEEAKERIAQTEPYEVTYRGETVRLEPIPADLKAKAEEARKAIAIAAAVGVEKGQRTLDATKLSMTRAFAGGDGKAAGDPLDRYLSKEFGTELPKLIDANKKDDNTALIQTLAAALSQKSDGEVDELKAIVLQQQEAIQQLLKKEEQRERMKQAREAKNNKEAA